MSRDGRNQTDHQFSLNSRQSQRVPNRPASKDPRKTVYQMKTSFEMKTSNSRTRIDGKGPQVVTTETLNGRGLESLLSGFSFSFGFGSCSVFFTAVGDCFMESEEREFSRAAGEAHVLAGAEG